MYDRLMRRDDITAKRNYKSLWRGPAPLLEREPPLHAHHQATLSRVGISNDLVAELSGTQSASSGGGVRTSGGLWVIHRGTVSAIQRNQLISSPVEREVGDHIAV